MAEEKKYAYMVGDIGIMYSFGAYYVAKFCKSKTGNKFMAYTLKRYKTLKGAENYLLRDYSHAERTAPEIKYGTEAFIKEGSYWK